MTSVYCVIRDLEETTKRTKKLEILKRHSDNQDLKRVFYLALHPNINFGIQQVPTILYCNAEQELSKALDFLEYELATRKVTGNQARDQLVSVIESLSGPDQNIVLCILNRNLDCGVSVATVNSVWPGLIDTCEFMLASTDPKGLKFPDVICQVKYDGMRVNVALCNDKVELKTRNNSKIDCPQHLAEEIKKILTTNEFIDGELLCYDSNGTPLIRQQGNGILNKLIQGTCKTEEIDTIHLVVWDLVSPSEKIPYMFRLQDLTCRVNNNSCGFIHIAESKVVTTFDELHAYFIQQLDLGFEGIVAKNMFHVWQPKRSKEWVKFKEVKTADLRVAKIIPGSGKYTGMMGALDLVSEDGKVCVSVGTGFSDAQRELLNNPRILGQIVEVAYNSRISSKTKLDSLYLPRFVRFRTDEKTVADNSSEIK